MSDPVLVEVFRGETVESRHRGIVVVTDGDGKIVFSLGDIERPTFPRSAIKAIQGLPLVESGAADAYGFGNEELALACASHSGEPPHVKRAADMLARAGLGVSDLECGAHWPAQQFALIALARAGEEPTALHNNCSGKHAGFLCTCRHLGIETRGYSALGSPEQDMVRDAMESVTGAAHTLDHCGTDGCSIPTYAIPLKNLAYGFARMATGNGLAPERAKAAKRLMDASMAAPFYVAGTHRACTELMEMAPGRIFVKTGAEGVYVGALPEFGIGFAIKCEDGATRAAEAITATVLARIFRHEAELESKLDRFADREMRNWNGITYGVISPTEALTDADIN